MSVKVAEITKNSDEKLLPIIAAIKNRENNKISKFNKIFDSINKKFISNVSNRDVNFSVGDDCTGCSVCKDVCPVKNIVMINNKPQYKHKCEQCLACLHFCPQKAINYMNVTQNRRRYTNPDISYKELSEKNNA